MSGFSNQEYLRIFRSNKYDFVIKNLREIAQFENFSKCRVAIDIRTDKVFHQFNKTYKELKQLGYKIGRLKHYDNWAGRIKTEDLSGFMFVRPNRKKDVPCSVLYDGPTIMWDGGITACGCRDMDGKSELYLGNIEQIGFEPWKDGTVEKLRQRFIDGNPPDICRDCRHYNRAY